MTRFKCLIFDHDDTTVDSTATIHYPCFAMFLDEYRPGEKISLEKYFEKNFDPGFIEMCQQDYGMNDDELSVEVKYWQDYVENHIPNAYDGIREIMECQRKNDGLICVISHSMKENILRDYKYNRLPMPDRIYGWEEPPEHRKPNTWPVEQILKEFNLQADDVLMIDDLKPGYDMAVSSGIHFAAAGWANDILSIETFMKNNSEFYFKSVQELRDFLFY